MREKATETDVCRVAIDSPSAWQGTDFKSDDDFITRLSAEEADELVEVVERFRRTGKPLTEMRAPDIPLEVFGEGVERVHREVTEGRGFVILRGLPIGTRLSEDDAKVVHWAIAQHMGEPVVQNSRGHLLGHVIARQGGGARRRTYESPVAQVYHSDGSDVVGLLCVRPAKRGGESTIASSVTMHNILLKERPDLLEILYATFYASRMGEEVPGQRPYYPIPIYTYLDGYLSCRPGTSYIKDAQRFEEVPRLSDDALEAIEYWKAIPLRPGIALNYMLESGDIQYLNNYTVVHGRSEYEDYDDPGQRRYLVRVLFRTEQSRPFTPEFEERRAGIPLTPEVRPNITLDPDAQEQVHS